MSEKLETFIKSVEKSTYSPKANADKIIKALKILNCEIPTNDIISQIVKEPGTISGYYNYTFPKNILPLFLATQGNTYIFDYGSMKASNHNIEIVNQQVKIINASLSGSITGLDYCYFDLHTTSINANNLIGGKGTVFYKHTIEFASYPTINGYQVNNDNTISPYTYTTSFAAKTLELVSTKRTSYQSLLSVKSEEVLGGTLTLGTGITFTLLGANNGKFFLGYPASPNKFGLLSDLGSLSISSDTVTNI